MTTTIQAPINTEHGRARPQRSISFRERDPFRIGVIGTTVTIALLAVALNSSALIRAVTTHPVRAVFAEAGGLTPGDDVRMAGTTVGSVTEVALDRAAVVVTMRIKDGVPLNSESTAAIRTATVLGRKYVSLVSAGRSPLDGDTAIPLQRTTSPYDITRTLGDLADSTRLLDTKKVADALDVGTETFSQTPEDFAAALDGIRRLSATISSRDEQLALLLDRAEHLTGVLADQRDSLVQLVTDGNTLLTTLLQQKAAIDNLFGDLSDAVDQLGLLVDEGRTTLHPALVKLKQTLALVNKHRDDVDLTLVRVGPFIRSLGEAVGSGPFFLAYVGNLSPQGFPETAGNP
jgi:phospholipid/cholesterol/gamma-HCH transport system substrate-binding protein